MRFLVVAVALASGMKKARSCSCFWGQSLCDKFGDAAIVLRAEVLSSERLGSSINDDIVYQVNTTEVFKGEDEPEVEYDVSMTFDLATGGNSALCGINMDEGEEYLIDLYRDDFNGGRLYAAGSCGLVRPWRSVSPDDQALLREGCEGYDPCDGACGPYQECTFFSTGYAEVEYYCSDSCDDPTQCGDEEVCELIYDRCVDYTRPCPPTATCVTVTTAPTPMPPCSDCGEYQECLVYTVGDVDRGYCQDTCNDPNKCDEGETCILEEVPCFGVPCPLFPRCTPAEVTTYEEIGCFKDTRDDRALGYQYDSSTMSAEICLEHCERQGAAYMATQYGYECWCYVTGRADFDRHGDGAVCDIPCQGNPDEDCGGYFAFTLYKLDWPAPPTEIPEYVGCYRDTRDDRVLAYPITLRDMTPNACRNHCTEKEDFTFYATQYGSECWCATTDSISDYTRHGDGVCHLPCSGDEDISCGGNYAFDLFSLVRNVDY